MARGIRQLNQDAKAIVASWLRQIANEDGTPGDLGSQARQVAMQLAKKLDKTDLENKVIEIVKQKRRK